MPGSTRHRQTGLGMIEILVALLILSIGLLGLAAMQVTSTKLTSQSQQKTQAILLAQDMIERVRSNRSNAGAYDDVAADDDDSCQTDLVPGGGTVADNDDQAWTNLVRCLLASGEGDVTVDTGAGTVTVDLTWASRMNDENNGAAVEGENELSITARY